ncbi:uncharacterized protein LOC133782297 isoform X2 [Humulus lupulus]|uniref:uncharacterized protein LOC133782297 isoform X2 n=1 Tax=Humulus lupulus TaxID=3486 RepID=UPI002B40BFBE|nr:uncharacterized protein LOC133782297 isoform X2 [Humulus lupulus]
MSSIMLTPTSKTTTLFKGYSISSSTLINLTPRVNHNRLIINKSSKLRKVAVITEFSAAADPAPDGFTWQIAVGALAGVTPFVVAGIEFSKRIVDFYLGSHGGDFFLAELTFYMQCYYISPKI